MIVFTADCNRDLKREEAAAASMALPAGAGKKKKEAAASERRVPLAPLLPNESTADARPAGAEKKTKEATAEKKMKEAVASELGDAAAHKEKEEVDSLFKEGEMLKLRQEFWEAGRLWREKLIPGALDRWLKRKETETTQVPAVAGKKRKVVRVMLPDNYIDYIQENPDIMRELTDEEMAECPERFRQKYAIIKLINDKSRAYQQALIDQYRAFGFAYDEKEVTDCEEDEAVVKN